MGRKGADRRPLCAEAKELRELFILDGATHKPEYVPGIVDKLTSFFRSNLEDRRVGSQFEFPRRVIKAIAPLGEQMMETSVRKFFERYERGDLIHVRVAAEGLVEEALYASEFIATSPAGVMTGKNDNQFKQAMAQGYARYRAIGTKDMRLRDVQLSPIDDQHCVEIKEGSNSLCC